MSSYLETTVELSSQDCARVAAEDDLRYVSLNQLYVEQCLFSIPKDDVTRIQHAVEIMVLFLLTSIYDNTCFTELICSNKAVKKVVSTFKVPPNILYAFNNKNLLKVGSYYENTKNHYPDEFDFICVIAECRGDGYVQMKDVTSDIADIFHTCLQQAVSKPFLAGTCIEFVRYVRLHGPASRLEFRKKDERSIGKSIFVDISPASKVYMQNAFQFELNNIVRYPEWQTITQATGSFLLLKVFRAGHPKHETKVKVSITETEQHYVLTEMSEKHKQVYRLLKYILNNDSIGEELRELMRSDENQVSVECCRVFYPRVVYDFPSYIIKTLMFHHCRHCNSNSKTVSDCILNVLDYILKLFKTEQERKLLCFYRLQRPFSVLVETMTGDMIEIADNYDSSLKIIKCITEIRNDIVNNRVTEQISLANEIVTIVRKQRKKRNVKKERVRKTAKICSICGFLVFICALVVGVYIFVHSSKQMLYCSMGTDPVEYINYTSLSLSDKHLNVQGKSASGVTAETTYCIEYRNDGIYEQRSGTSMSTISKIYYCGDRRFCTTNDKLYRIRLGNEVAKGGIEQQLNCSAIDFEIRRESGYLPSDNYQNGRRLVCFRNEPSCMNFMFAFTFLDMPIAATCLPTVHVEDTNVGCYISKRIILRLSTQTEICCCGKYGFEYAVNGEESIQAGQISVISSAVSVLLLCCLGCCCLDAWLKYWMHKFKRKYQR